MGNEIGQRPRMGDKTKPPHVSPAPPRPSAVLPSRDELQRELTTLRTDFAGMAKNYRALALTAREQAAGTKAEVFESCAEAIERTLLRARV